LKKKKGSVMSRVCQVCGKRPGRGNKKVERGKPKYLGGNGRKTTGISKRQFLPNLQRIRVQGESGPEQKRVCVQCIRSERVQKAVVRSAFSVADN
jgi:large subunit ribosomal protein L28